MLPRFEMHCVAAVAAVLVCSVWLPLSTASNSILLDDISLERKSPQLVDMELVEEEGDEAFQYSSRLHRGFPRHTNLFDYDEAAPLSASETVRWHLLSAMNRDHDWRSQRISSGPLRVVERYSSIDLLGGITRVGEYYTKILIGGQPVRVQVDTGSSTLALPVAEVCPFEKIPLHLLHCAGWFACWSRACTNAKPLVYMVVVLYVSVVYPCRHSVANAYLQT